MTDLTKIDKPFGDLDRETQAALLLACYVDGKKIEGKVRSSSRMVEWAEASNPWWYPNGIYRVASEPLRDIDAPWDYLPDWVEWVARDEGSRCYAYQEKPEPKLRIGLWETDGKIKELCLKDVGNKPWDQSLVRRPQK